VPFYYISGKLQVLFLLMPKISIFALQARPIAPIHVKFGMAKRHVRNFTSIRTLYHSNGLDVLYHHANVGGDRTTRAGCSCENMVFQCFYRQDVAKPQTSGIVFTERLW